MSTTDREKSTWIDYLIKAREKHLHQLESMLLPNFIEFASDVEIYLGELYGEKVIPAGVSLFMQPSDNPNEQIVYAARLENTEFLNRLNTEPTDEENHFTTSDDIEMKFVFEPVAVGNDGKPLIYPVLVLWLAINVAPDDDTRTWLFKEGYGIDDSAIERIKRGTNVDTTKVISPIDAVTGRIFSTGDDKIKPQQMFSAEPIEVVTRHAKGKAKEASLSLILRTDADIDADENEYMIAPRDRFWLDVLYSRVWNDGGEPITVIKGSDLLKIAGYTNPYASSMRSTMNEALSAVLKLSSTRVAIDTTNERGAFYDAVKVVTLRPIINCGDVDITQRKDGGFDFGIELSRDLSESLPLLDFAMERKQLISFDTRFYEFKKVKRLTSEHRWMWHYVLRRSMEEHSSDSIKFDTMFKSIGLDGANNRKRGQMLVMLKKMLREKKDDGLIDYTWKMNGKKDYAVVVKITG